MTYGMRQLFVSLRSLLHRLRWAIFGSHRGPIPRLANLERPNFFSGQLLTAEELEQEQAYFRERLRRHNRLVHGWGIVSGLEVSPAGGCDVTVSPGYALDPSGEEVVVPEPAHLDVCAAGGLGEGRSAYLAVRYAEEGISPIPVEGDAPAYSRIREGFELAVLAQHPQEPWVVLAAVTLLRGEVSVESGPRRNVGC